MVVKKPKVAILTDLTDLDCGYSIASVSCDHSKMLRRYGYEYSFFVCNYFNENDYESAKAKNINIQPAMPGVSYHAYQTHEEPRPDFESGVLLYTNALCEELKSFDVVLTHDLMFQAGHLIQNQAIRKCSERLPHLRWIHWMHSGPCDHPPYPNGERKARPGEICYPSTLRFSMMPKSKYISMNGTNIQRVANMYLSDTSHFAVVYNPRDPREWHNMAKETWAFTDEYGVLDRDIVQLYPFSTPRWSAKGVRQLMALFGALKEDQGLKVLLILATAHSNTPEIDNKFLEEIESWALRFGLKPDEDVVLTSRFSDKMAEREPNNASEWKRWRYSVPPNVIRELFLLSDVFVFPSVSEGCSLVQAEAAIAGNHVVINRDFVPMAEFAPQCALRYDFSSRSATDIYWKYASRELWAELSRDRILRQRRQAFKTYSYDAVWRQLEPIILGLYHDAKYGNSDSCPERTDGVLSGSE